MALSFLSVGNQRGATCYVIYGSHPDDIDSATEFQTEINAEHPGVVVLIDKHSNDARSLLQFYSISDNRFPMLLLVREDDSLSYHWTSTLPTVDDVIYRLHQIGE